MNDHEFNSSIHTSQFFEVLDDTFNKNKSRIANHLGISRSTLYIWIERAKNIKENHIDKAIRLVSFDNLKDHLATCPEKDRNAYLLNEIIRPGKPLRSNTLLIIGAIRDMLRSFK